MSSELLAVLRQWTKGRARLATSPAAPKRRLRKLGCVRRGWLYADPFSLAFSSDVALVQSAQEARLKQSAGPACLAPLGSPSAVAPRNGAARASTNAWVEDARSGQWHRVRRRPSLGIGPAHDDGVEAVAAPTPVGPDHGYERIFVAVPVTDCEAVSGRRCRPRRC